MVSHATKRQIPMVSIDTEAALEEKGRVLKELAQLYPDVNPLYANAACRVRLCLVYGPVNGRMV